MTDINITELRQRLPGHLARASKGERLRVTSRSTVIAKVGPPTHGTTHAARTHAQLAGSALGFDDPFETVLEPSRWASA